MKIRALFFTTLSLSFFHLSTTNTQLILPFLEPDNEELLEYAEPQEIDLTEKDSQVYGDIPSDETSTLKRAHPKKEWTIITYMAADNDLAMFAKKNLSQQASIGSNERVNILVHLDTRALGNSKITKRYYIEKDRLVIVSKPNLSPMDSGNPNTLIECCEWAIKHYPAKHYALILWNHGTGIIDIERPRAINPSDLFTFNPSTNLIELDRSIPFLQFLKTKPEQEMRGICFDDSTGHYLTNQGLEYALQTITNSMLKGKKIDIIGFDACLMAMLEIANILKNYCSIVVGSQEVELGTGWPYHLAFAPLSQQNLSPKQLASHIVDVYESTYATITTDYTQSAFNLEQASNLEKYVNDIAELLIYCLKHQVKTSVRDALRASRHKLLCVQFEEPSYICLGDFLHNLQANLHRFKIQGDQHALQRLAAAIKSAHTAISDGMIANKTGKNLKKALGISIYFPETRIHRSYHLTKFAKENQWHNFLHAYLGL